MDIIVDIIRWISVECDSNAHYAKRSKRYSSRVGSDHLKSGSSQVDGCPGHLSLACGTSVSEAPRNVRSASCDSHKYQSLSSERA